MLPSPAHGVESSDVKSIKSFTLCCSLITKDVAIFLHRQGPDTHDTDTL